MGRLIGAIIALIAVGGCREELPAFFRQSAEEQRAQARKLTTPQLYELYKQSFDLPPPPLYVLVEPLGERGRDVVNLWVTDIVNTGALSEDWEFGPLLSSVRKQTGETICKDEKALTTAANSLAKLRGASVTAMTNRLRQYC